MSESRDRLGRGLGALLGEYLPEAPDSLPVREVAVEAIVPNPFQPRREFDPQELEALSRSISDNGLLQPLVVRPAGNRPGRFELVAGERRLRAVAKLGWTEVAAVVREVDDESLLVFALVENLQREELTPLEEAEGYRALADQFGLTQDQIANAVGKDRSTVANMLRLLRLPASVRKLVDEGRLSAGHARALLGVKDATRAAELARRCVAGGWSVRDVERRVRALNETKTVASPAGGSSDALPPEYARRVLEEALREALGTRVKLRGDPEGGGTVEVPFRDSEDLARLFARFTGREVGDVLG